MTPAVMGGGGFIRELCIALEHRWNPEQCFLLFTAYFDEADTHAKAPAVIMAGFLGTARQWKLFERRLAALQRRGGFSIFHVTDFKHRSGEFRGWSEEKCLRLADALTNLVRDNLTEGLTIYLEHERYVSEYRAAPFPKKMPRDTQYGLCFRACLRQLTDVVLADGKKKHRLNIVIEQGHGYLGGAIRIFDDIKERQSREGIDLLGDITAASKKERAPLMAGDFLAAARCQPQAGGLTFLEFPPGSLQQLKTDWEADRRERVKTWRQPHQTKASGIL